MKIILNSMVAGGFPCTIVHNSVNTFYFIKQYDFVNLCKYFPWELCCFCCHEVTCVDRRRCNSIFVSSEVTHGHRQNAYWSVAVQVLSKTFVNAGLWQFLRGRCNLPSSCTILTFSPSVTFVADDIGIPKTRAQGWLTVYKVLSNTEFQTCFADFILKKHS